jgi:methionyl-tRNA formyltransferase
MKTADDSSLRIIFMGTPAFAVPSLEILVKNGFEVVAVITAPDKPAGRGLKPTFSDVKKAALDLGLKVMQPEKLKDPVFLDEVRSLKADLQVVVAFRMLPEVLWSMPRFGTFNLHGSLLPQYRGAAPIQRAIMNGEKKTGVTTFFLQQEIDTGNIIHRVAVDVGPDVTAGELHDRLMVVGADLVLKTVQEIHLGQVHVHPQSEFVSEDEVLHAAPKIFREDMHLDCAQSVQALHNRIRGLSPYPGAFFELETPDGERMQVKVFRSRPEQAGTVLTHELICDGKSVKLSAADGFLHLLELQLPGKKRMKADELLRGYRFPELARVV